MKLTVTIIRILTGLLFIFSGLVKAIDPRGLAYKMEEFFQAWSSSGFMPGLMAKLENFQLSFSIIMITLEVVVGVALLTGYKKKLTTVILLLLMLFFTFLTSYVLFTGKIRACGCFGDCIPLTPNQTFSKDIVLLIFSIILLIFNRYITPVARPSVVNAIVFIATVLVLFLQWHVLRNLPVVDCLPYKKGNNLTELRKMPANAIPDKFDYMFVYEKAGKKQEFKADATPDSTWTFVDRKQVLVQKGSNNMPVINDYALTTESGNDSTDAILGQQGEYYILYIKDLNNYPSNWSGDKALIERVIKKGKKIFIVSGQVSNVKAMLAAAKAPVDKVPFLSADATVIKTIARVNPTLYLMNGGVVKDKWSYTKFDGIEK